MQWKRQIAGLTFSFVFAVSHFTNKFVLSVLKFTYPTLFQGWQTFIGVLLLLLSAKLGWVEISHVNRSAAVSWLPGSMLYVGIIYAGSRALSQIDIPLFFTLQNSSHVVSYIILKLMHREKTRWLKFISICLMLLSGIYLPLCDPQFDFNGYVWAVGHLFCVGAYRVFQVHHKSTNFSDIEQQCINYMLSVLLLAIAAHPTGDLVAVLEFPSLHSSTFHCSCCASQKLKKAITTVSCCVSYFSALLGFLLLLATVKLKSGLSIEHFTVWIFLSKITAMVLSPFIFEMNINASYLLCVVISHVGEALMIYTERESHQ